MKEFDEFAFNRLEERAWESERKLAAMEKAKEGNAEVKTEQRDRERCSKCLSGEMQIFCEVCRYGE